MTLFRYNQPVNVVDDLLVRMSDFVFGDLSCHGVVRPELGALLLKAKTG
jgi:indole-3-pyruvate monooxygenase